MCLKLKKCFQKTVLKIVAVTEFQYLHLFVTAIKSLFFRLKEYRGKQKPTVNLQFVKGQRSLCLGTEVLQNGSACCVLLFLVNVHESWLWKANSVVFGVRVLSETLLECRAEQHLWHSAKLPHCFSLQAASLYHPHGTSNSLLLLICLRWGWRRGTSPDWFSVLSQDPQVGLTKLLCGPSVELFSFWSTYGFLWKNGI